MYSIFYLSLFAALTCGIENGRCEEECDTLVDSSDVVCICPINEILVDNEICLCKLIIYQMLRILCTIFYYYSSVTVLYIV